MPGPGDVADRRFWRPLNIAETDESSATRVNVVRVSSDPVGRAIKKALEHLQASHPTDTFVTDDLAPLDADYRAVEDARRDPLRHWSEHDLEHLAGCRILEALEHAGLTEEVGTVGIPTYRLTRDGQNSTCLFVGE